MAIWLGAWTGDNAGVVTGRQPNRLLISLTHSDATFPSGIFQHGDFHGEQWYFNFYVTCLTPNTRPAIATAVEDVGDYVWSVEVTEVDWGDPAKQPWSSGVHLFSAMLLADGGHQSGVIASAVIDDAHKTIDASQPEPGTGYPGGWGDFGGWMLVPRRPFPGMRRQ